MAKKLKANHKRKQERTDKTVVNIYNHGTVNIDARQNNSRAYKHENRGCTINAYDDVTTTGETDEILMLTESTIVAATRQIVKSIINGKI